MPQARRSASSSFNPAALEAAVAELGDALAALRGGLRLKQVRAQGTSRSALRGKALTGKLTARPSATAAVADPFEGTTAPTDSATRGAAPGTPFAEDWVPLLEIAGLSRPEPPTAP